MGAEFVGRQAPEAVRHRQVPLARLVADAAVIAPDHPAVHLAEDSVSFSTLVSAARSAFSSSTSTGIDDSALTIALMTTVPGLAASGPSGLAATLTALRVRASMVVALGRDRTGSPGHPRQIR